MTCVEKSLEAGHFFSVVLSWWLPVVTQQWRFGTFLKQNVYTPSRTTHTQVRGQRWYSSQPQGSTVVSITCCITERMHFQENFHNILIEQLYLWLHYVIICLCVSVWGCTWHTCGDFVASCSMDNTCKLWDLNSLRCRFTMRGHADSVNSIEFLPYSNTLLSSSADKTLSLWDARTVSFVC